MSADDPQAEFDLKDGSRLTLYANRVVHEGGGALEIVPLGRLAAVRVAFERDARHLNWAIALIAVALILYAVASPLQESFAKLAAGLKEHPGRESLDGVLLASFSALAGLSRMLSPIAAVLGAVAAALVGLFWLGSSRLTLCFGAIERSYAVRGRNRELIGFAEAVAERLAARAD
jgi:hypothetical protein